VIATGWGGIKVMDVPENIFVIDSAPHDWLFPCMSAVVHHGGAGTTAEGLRAGVPSVIVPFIVDQLFWGKRVEALGVGTKPLQAKRLTADKLAEAIQTVTTDSRMRGQSFKLGKTIRAERGVDNAVKLVKQYSGD
jgi:sterol 3beta-glucosyltransferase